jgi:hypothetical protein
MQEQRQRIKKAGAVPEARQSKKRGKDKDGIIDAEAEARGGLQSRVKIKDKEKVVLEAKAGLITE